MNRLEGNIADILTHGNLSLVSVDLGRGLQIQAIVIERPETAEYLQEGNRIAVLFKETEVILGSPDSTGISVQNRIPIVIMKIHRGRLLSRVQLKSPAGNLEAIVPSDAVSELDLKEAGELTAFVKTNEVMLAAL